MSALRHTPGPWRINPNCDLRRTALIEPVGPGRTIARVFNNSGHREGDARLIAAAPAMAALLSDALATLSNVGGGSATRADLDRLAIDIAAVLTRALNFVPQQKVDL